ncbi:transglutaminase family protein [Rhizobium alvei]|uniref:Transglutaminase family protein n=1 Tax=Rhizobium alvei TaxID=1132659 RepID=A0ABT8YUB3_9HYPH|nr:transglutaminase family protein [Rhizobium alvei]MDO6967116.1 transglutaminase family protein [Rhizobium alvei]
MRLLLIFIALVACLTAPASARAFEFHNIQLESQVAALFQGSRDIAEIKLTIDRMVEPGVDVAANLQIINGMAADLERMRAEAGVTSDLDKLAILRRYIYEPGPWNGGKAFSYDLDDPMGVRPENRLLSDYLGDRRGNCVSMPMLMMILGNRMGLLMTLAEAPQHSLIKFTDSEGREWNLEATSGGGFTRESHYRKEMPSLTETAIKNGVYLRGLPRDEMIAGEVSGMLVAHLIGTGRLEDAVAVSDQLLTKAPKSIRLKLARASVLSLLLKRDITDRYKRMNEMTPDIRAYADDLYRQNMAAFAEAEALGWREPGGKF